jgi:hypothetical protein
LLKKNIIHKCSALMLLLLFIVSNTPKQLLHDFFANHVDYKNVLVNQDTPHLNQLSFHCQVNHLVVETPFTNEQQSIVFYQPLNYRIFTPSLYHFIVLGFPSQLDLRGPPEKISLS